MILSKVFEKAEERLDYQRDFNYTLQYVTLQFAEAARCLYKYMDDCACLRFYKYAGETSNINEETIQKIKQLNRADFENNYLNKHHEFKYDKLIKIPVAIGLFEKLEKVNTLNGYLNSYTQIEVIRNTQEVMFNII